MFGVSLTEMLVIAVIAMVVLKPEDLPKVAQTLGRGLRFMRQASAEARAALAQNLDLDRTAAKTAKEEDGHANR